MTYFGIRPTNLHTPVGSCDSKQTRRISRRTAKELGGLGNINAALRISKVGTDIVFDPYAMGGKQECRGGRDSSHPRKKDVRPKRPERTHGTTHVIENSK